VLTHTLSVATFTAKNLFDECNDTTINTDAGPDALTKFVKRHLRTERRGIHCAGMQHELSYMPSPSSRKTSVPSSSSGSASRPRGASTPASLATRN
jgi:hypothetical protein